MRVATFQLDGVSACWHDGGYGELWFARDRPVTARAVVEVAARIDEWRGEAQARLLVDVTELGPIAPAVVKLAVREHLERGRLARAKPVLAFVARDVLPSVALLFLQASRAHARTFRDLEKARAWLLAREVAPRA